MAQRCQGSCPGMGHGDYVASAQRLTCKKVVLSWKGRSMRGIQSKASEVRRAVERLSDAGIVERVRLAPVNTETSRPESKVVKLHRKVVVVVTVAGRSPERHSREIQRLVEQAGITGVDLRFEHSGV